MAETSKNFYSKVLLFGEYTVTLGSGALAIPYQGFRGHSDYGHGHDESRKNLFRLLSYVSKTDLIENVYDLEAFTKDLENGLYFSSNIPAGYGLGSSGAVVAWFYHSYSTRKTTNLGTLKNILGATENAFHGSSSGIDPLVSYIHEPLMIKDSNDISIVNPNLKNKGLFLLDTGLPRETAPLVAAFKEKYLHHDSFKETVHNLSEYNRVAIQSILGDISNDLYANFHNISALQYEHFSEMIPLSFRKLWLSGLQSEQFYLKLCGAGGGGMILGMLKDQTHYPQELTDFTITFL
ncbi:MAG: mevalonate kinase [Saprospiraceae bacterium]|nr:mevalonate kinase [Saprospiraceae bacterium]